MWDDLRYVLAVAEQGTLSGAARALGVNHSTVLRRISGFEEKKGVQVFERTATGYVLTPESRHLLSALQAINDQVSGLDRAIAKQNLELDGPVRITTSDSIAAAGLTRYVAAFQAEHPDTTVDLNISNSYVNFSKLDADITIRPAQALSPELAGERACELLMRVYATPQYLEHNRGRKYGGHKWLGVGPPIASTMVGEWQRQNLAEADIVLKSNSFVGLLNVAEAGLGLALLPCGIGDPSPHLVRANAFPETLTTSLWVATHKDMIASAKVQSILTWFVEAIRRDADLFEGRAAGNMAAE
ncbi:MAG: LysR family transcriptional regulator [Rhodospirillaceae bacterium]|jgi:DNA-binding transcriptional LysR family regulator|nr:LysR family transcriptional regulator [Rhodospirillaceae bacterium]MBT4688253.1 LysR family transcriptional regulator [Rhodospirillaceae bacterium]MBT5079246.1 LysR family transcriptional regulator [Rhodospirillaceae bacterium]MBT5522470.1 LysR family transcriptional regulator [Rhodospirillaceae bacterium]MBT5877623.1 LysR family transcriptional regulator [Rhodospirillaceae bacterium]